MADQRVVVKRNTDDTLLMSTFGNIIAGSAASTNPMAGEQFKDEPWDYIPGPGISTRRGSRPVESPDGTPFGSPVDVVHREIMNNPILREVNPDEINPYQVITRTDMSHVVDKANKHGDGFMTPSAKPPTQNDSIPEEFREMVQHQAQFVSNQRTPDPTVVPDVVMQHPRQYTPEHIPSAPGAYHEAPPPRPVLPPMEERKPVQITSDMIIKINGYNETNMYLLTQVSKNIALCSEMISKLNNTQLPVDVVQVVSLLNFLDQSSLRKTLADVFGDILKTNMGLSTEISSYLSGTGVIADTESSESGSAEGPSQSTSGDSVSPSIDADEPGE